MDEYLGVIKLFAGNFAPVGWLFCQGQTLPIQQYAALFSLLGATYGGNGNTTFCLPDLRGFIPIGAGDRPGYSSVPQGSVGSLTSHGTRNIGTLGMNYIICVEGLYPQRP